MIRDELKNKLAEKIEADLELLGSTAIEDVLQDNVDVTIQALKDAGMIVWVLTGDKIETAINVGYSCGLIKKDMLEVVIDTESMT